MSSDMGSQQGIRALPGGIAIGGKFRFWTGSGTPAATFSAQNVGDLYLDYTNAVLYIASATGTGGWTAYAGLSSMASGAKIGGTAITTGNGTPTVTASVPARIGDLYVDYAAGKLYVASGISAASDYKIVTSA